MKSKATFTIFEIPRAPKQKTFDECLDEAFTNIVRGKLEDVRDALNRFAERVRSMEKG